MNAKTYCPLGKINCGRFRNYQDGRGIRCEIDNGNESTSWFISDFDTCPFTKRQQKIERYDMCEDQPAQIQCYNHYCIYHTPDKYGECTNQSPAIWLGGVSRSWDKFRDGSWNCFSFKEQP